LRASSTGAPVKRFTERRFEGPRRVKHGLRLSSKESPTARTPLAQRWMRLIEDHVDAASMQQGLEYARSGQIVSMQTLAGEIDAHVQGSAPRPYVTRISVPAFTEAQWQTLIDAMAGEAIYVAKLLANELPPGIDELFAQRDAALLPATGVITSSCSCPTGVAKEGGCKHVATAAHLFADQLSDRPLQIFTLLGLPADRLIEQLRQARLLHAHGVASAHGEAVIPAAQVAAPPLESLLEDFWRGGIYAGDADDSPIPVPNQPVRHALLRRLGPSPLKGKFPLVGLLASIYDVVSEAARRKGEAAPDMAAEDAEDPPEADSQ
jgi:uncharacterized Zn finger protein